MNQKNRLTYYALAAICVIVIAVGALIAYRTFATPMLPFTNTTYGISFSYPATYAIEEHDLAGHHSIVLAEKAARAATPVNGEGPTTMTFDIYANSAHLAPSQWVKTNSASNFKLSPDGALASSTSGGREAVAYTWDGLYRGESYVFSFSKGILMASVTYNATNDRIHKDFQRVLPTLTLE